MGVSAENSLMGTSLLAIVGGVAISAMYPPYAVIGSLISWSGICGGAYSAVTWSKFDRLFKNLGFVKGNVQPVLKKRVQSDFSTTYKFSVPPGISSDDFVRKQSAIEEYLNRDVDIHYANKQVVIEVFNHQMKSQYDFEETNCKGAIEFPVGYDRRGKLITCNLTSGEPHLLIAGETGSGKSTVLRAIITNILLTKNIKLHLIDLKRGAEFQIFARCKNVENFARTKSEAYQVLNLVSKEVDRRYDLFYENDVVDIKEYNRKVGKLGYEMLIIDEFADLHREKQSIALLEEIAAKARACGISLCISTQRPSRDILNGVIKANVTSVLGLKTLNDINSRIVIDHDGLEDLAGKGQGIFKKNGEEVLIQCPYLTTERARELLRLHYVDGKNKPISPQISPYTSDGDILC